MSATSNFDQRSLRSGSYVNLQVTDRMRERRPTDINEPRITGFDVNRVYKAFVDALREPNNPKSPIGTQDYINGYRELLKFFDQLGAVFKFVKDDVVDKLAILQKFVDRDNQIPTHYDTIQKAVDYETEKRLIKTNPENFTRTLLRLHRALIFIVLLLQDLNDRPPTESTATVATSCYEVTLHQHHSFLVRKSVKVGFRLLPNRKQLDDVIFRGRKAELSDQYKSFIKTIKQIYDTVDAYYAEKNYLQLP